MSSGRPGLSAGLNLAREQRMDPRLYQAMDLLHMPLLDLQAHLRRELVDNPFLELVEPGDEEEQPAGDVDWEESLFDEYETGGRRDEYADDEYFTPAATATRSLWDHLHDQLNLLRLGERQVLIGEEIIGNIDRDGFLSCSLDRIVEALEGRMGDSGSVRRTEVEDMLARVQGFDPSGIAARDVRETLLLQLRDRRQEASLAYRIIRDHFDELANHRWNELAREYGVTPREAQTAADEIAKLDPKPGLRVADSPSSYVIPDLTVEKIDGRYHVSHNNATLPRLMMSRTYRDVVADPARFKGENRLFIRERLDSAKWLIQAIEQRRRTMLKVMKVIIDRQRVFFEKGVEHLRPLTLREVAQHIDMHESTVSRVSNEKYVQTPRGLYPLKFFFSGGYSTDGGADVSARGVKAHIGKLIAGEDPKSPLSDHALVDVLRRDGVRIARRTVTKYRDQLGILSARLRKRV